MANGNFVPYPSGRSVPAGSLSTRVSPCEPISGNGTPEGNVPGNPGQRYTDIDNGNMYLKIQGTAETGWRLVGSIGAAGIQPV